MSGCQGCRNGEGFSLPFSMAFQPIVDLSTGQIYAYEALVRGLSGESAYEVLSNVTEKNRYAFDQACRVKAIQVAACLNCPEQGALLSINFLPNAVYEPKACIQLTLATAAATGFPVENLMFEFTENERLEHDHIGKILSTYRGMGFRTAIDDFGAGYAGLTLLAKWQPDIIKLDMELVRGIDRDRVRRALVGSIASACRDLGVLVLGEGVETLQESDALRELGVHIQQGYLLARPAFEQLPIPKLPATRSTAQAA